MIQQYEAVSLSQKTISNNALKLILKVVKKGTTESKEVFQKAFVCGMYKEKEVFKERKERIPREIAMKVFLAIHKNKSREEIISELRITKRQFTHYNHHYRLTGKQKIENFLSK